MESSIGVVSGRSRNIAYIHNTTVDVSKLLQAKKSGSMSTVVESKALEAYVSFPRRPVYSN